LNLRKRQKLSDDHPIQIFYVWNYLEWGGAQTYFLGLMRTVKERYRTMAVMPKGSEEKILRYLEEDNIEYDFFDGNMVSTDARTFSQKIKRRLNDLKVNFALAGKLFKYDLKNSAIQIDAAPWSAFGLLFCLVLKTNVFVTLHTAIPEISFFRRSLWKAKLAILSSFKNFHLNASNLDVKKSLRSLMSETRLRQVNVIYSMFNAVQFEYVLAKNQSKSEIAEKYDLPTNKIWICNVGQFIERKGCWVFLEAIEILQKQRNDLFFLWLGTNAPDKNTAEKISKYKLNDNFRFLSANEIGGQRSDLLSLWNANDIFVLPSFQEGLPMSLIEAMALGKPCIASDINAIPEAVKHLENGILLEPGNALKLAKAIGTLADDPDLQKKLGDNARKTAFEKFEEKIIGRKMLEIYDDSLRQKTLNY
jgi:glycosyltransferase involved in cell wall biosynthesis